MLIDSLYEKNETLIESFVNVQQDEEEFECDEFRDGIQQSFAIRTSTKISKPVEYDDSYGNNEDDDDSEAFCDSVHKTITPTYLPSVNNKQVTLVHHERLKQHLIIEQCRLVNEHLNFKTIKLKDNLLFKAQTK